jgi:hypothetical protein
MFWNLPYQAQGKTLTPYSTSLLLTLQGFGFVVNCSTTFIPPNSDTAKQFLIEGETNIGDSAPAFVIQASIPGPNTEFIDLNSNQTQQAQFVEIEEIGLLDVTSVVKSNPRCQADLSVYTCSLHRAIVEYDVTLQIGTIALQHANWQQDTPFTSL